MAKEMNMIDHTGFKLVRDEIPRIINDNGGTADFYVASEPEYKERLLKKLVEEANEFALCPSEEEFADILEVLDAIKSAFNLEENDIVNIKNEKLRRAGSFGKRIVLKLDTGR